jgi:Uma2 family endonuclease
MLLSTVAVGTQVGVRASVAGLTGRSTMSAVPQPILTAQEYLEGERLSETKHEFLDGEIYALAGATEPHNLIVGNVIREVGTQLKGRRCRVYPSDMRLQVAETGLFTYPDVMIVCEEPRLVDDKIDTLLNPKVIFEVLSESTEANDRGWKWAHYRQLASLVEYVLVAQDVFRVEQFVRQSNGTWTFRDYLGLDAVAELPSIQCALPLSEVYYLVEPPTAD